MQIILIYNNEELFKALIQASKFLPNCEIKHSDTIAAQMLDGVLVFIADTNTINEVKAQLNNKNRNLGRDSRTAYCGSIQIL